jgi:hypothetical protein
MTTITAKRGDLFEEAVGVCGLFIYHGRPGMSFFPGYRRLMKKFQILNQYPDPFNKGPITLENGSRFLCILAESMSDKELTENLIQWLTYANEEGLKTIGLTGVRDSAKHDLIEKDIKSLVGSDNQRVELIVDVLTRWLLRQPHHITEILLISLSDNFTRNLPRTIHVP